MYSSQGCLLDFILQLHTTYHIPHTTQLDFRNTTYHLTTMVVVVAVVVLHSNTALLTQKLIFPLFIAFIVLIIDKTRFDYSNRMVVHCIDVKGSKAVPFCCALLSCCGLVEQVLRVPHVQ